LDCGSNREEGCLEKEGKGVEVKVIHHDTSNKVQNNSAWEQQLKKLQANNQRV